MSRLPRMRMLAPFEVRSFRFQWSADLATSLAFEMETVALGWFILVETGSVVLLTLFASLQYVGTLLAPMVGLVGDRIGHRRLLCLLRSVYLALGAVLALLAFAGLLTPAAALVVSALAGLVRPSDSGMRNVLISEIVPSDRLLAGLGLSRITGDSARGLGALAGAGMMAALGMSWTYVIVVALYAASVALTLRIEGPARLGGPVGTRLSPWRDMRAAIAGVWSMPPQLVALSLAFLINLTTYPFILGLLPYVAREIYRTGQADLGWMVAAGAAGSVAASLIVGQLQSRVMPGRVTVLAAVAWQLLTIALGQATGLAGGLVILFLAGLALGLCIVPLSALQLRNAPPELRGRITGLRTLAVYGLPLGLWLSGPMIERVGFEATATLYGGVGLACTLLMLVRWRAHIWPADAPANRR